MKMELKVEDEIGKDISTLWNPLVMLGEAHSSSTNPW